MLNEAGVGRGPRPRRARRLHLVLLAAALLVIAGCGTIEDARIPRPGTSPSLADVAATAVPSATASPPAAASVGASAGCVPGLWRTIKDHVGNPAVALVGLVDGCREAHIETTLEGAQVPAGVAICTSAAEVAYPTGITRIVVTSADGSRIAWGAAGSRCTGA